MTSKDFSKRFNIIQPVIGLIIIIGLFIFGNSLNTEKPKLAFNLFAGVMIGYILTRSRYGFAGGIKRIYVRGEGSLTKALLVALGTTSIIYFGMHWYYGSQGAVAAYLATDGQQIIPGTQNVFLTNIGTILGGFIFGIGMIIAGGCASGTLADFGEGEAHAFIAFPFFVLGTIPGHYLRAVIDRNPIGKGFRIYLPDYFGYLGALIVTILGLVFLYVLTKKYENMRKAEKTYRTPTSDWEDFEKELTDIDEAKPFGIALYHKLFVERWSFMTGSFLLTAISGAILIFNNKAWGVTSAFTKMAVWFVGLFGVHITDPSFVKINESVANGILHDAGVLLDLGIIFGSFICFLLAGRFKANLQFNAKDAMMFGMGGLLMGFGSRLSKGCNIGALYSSIPNFSISGWVFLVAISLGAVVGLKMFAGGRSCLVPPKHRNKADFE